MKKIKSLACLVLLTLLGACHGYSSATFSSTLSSETPSSISSESSVPISSSSSSSLSSSSIELTSSIISSSIPSSSSEISSSNSVSSSEPSSSSASSSLSSETSSSSSASSSSSSSYSSSSSSENSTSSTPIEPPRSYYEGYYDNLVSWTDGEDLKNQLYDIMREGYTPLSFANNFESNINADHDKYDFEYLDVVYSNNDVYKGQTNTGWQREHAFCASLMCGSSTGEAVKQKGRATDFHNLFAANSSANGSRGNKNYGQADKSATNYTNRTTNSGEDGYSFALAFEPGNKDKGRLARAIFYMATMYKNDEEDTANNITMKGLTIVEDNVPYIQGENGYFAHGYLSDLLKWNSTYQVDYLEMQHNISVYTNTNNPDGVAQGNRNPYIDYPELVNYVYGSKKEQAGQLEDLIPSALALDSEKDEVSHYALKEAKRDYGFGEKVQQEDYKVVAVNKNYTYDEVTANLSHSLKDHTFSESDGDKITAKISTPLNEISYQIVLNPMLTCATGELPMNKDGIDASKADTELPVKYGDIDFLLTFSSSSSDNIYLQNDNQNGGFTIGSGPKPLTKLVIKTKQSYEMANVFYVKAQVANNTSSYKLTIKVGEEVVLRDKAITNKGTYQLYGTKTYSDKSGQISFIFEGSTGLKLNSIAFNALIA